MKFKIINNKIKNLGGTVMTEMSTKYNPTEVENNRYNWWLEKEVFKADNKSKKNP